MRNPCTHVLCVTGLLRALVRHQLSLNYAHTDRNVAGLGELREVCKDAGGGHSIHDSIRNALVQWRVLLPLLASFGLKKMNINWVTQFL
jgi:hypothetical protein